MAMANFLVIFVQNYLFLPLLNQKSTFLAISQKYDF